MATGNVPVPDPEGFWQTVLHGLHDPTHFAIFKAADFWLGVVGFAITLGGFWIAAIRLKKVEDATKLAAEAVTNFKLRIHRYDAASDVSSAKYALSSIPGATDASDWRTVDTAMTDIHHVIGRISNVMADLDGDLSREMLKASSKLDRLMTVIDRSYTVGSPQPDKADIKKVCRATVVVFQRAQHILQENA